MAIARKNGRTGWRVKRRINRPRRTRFSKHQSMCIEDEPPNVCLLQEQFQAGRVSAFRQPKSDWLGAEKIDVHISPDQNLGACGLKRLLLKNGKQTVGRGAGDDFESARLPQLAKSGKQIALPFIDKKTLAFREELEIEAGQLSQFSLRTISFFLPLCQIDQEIEVSHIALA